MRVFGTGTIEAQLLDIGWSRWGGLGEGGHKKSCLVTIYSAQDHEELDSKVLAAEPGELSM